MTISSPVQERIQAVAEDINLGRIESSYKMATKTLDILTQHVRSNSWTTARELIEDMKDMCVTLKEADASETVARNMILRALKIVRDEYSRLSQTDLQETVFEGLEIMDAMITEQPEDDYEKSLPDLRESILGFFEEWEAEIDVSAENIAKEALKHVINDEVILTLGSSKTVEAFLLKAAAKRSFQVIVAEAAPFCHGHDMAISLSAKGINTTVIPDSAIFTVLSRVTKVIIGTQSVTANGGLKAVSGSYGLALAAKHHSVPLIVLAAMFKYTPEFLVSHDQSTFNRVVSPESVLPVTETDLINRVSVVNPVFDYVPPELVTVLIAGEKEGHSPSYVYHKLSTLYHRRDYLEV